MPELESLSQTTNESFLSFSTPIAIGILEKSLSEQLFCSSINKSTVVYPVLQQSYHSKASLSTTTFLPNAAHPFNQAMKDVQISDPSSLEKNPNSQLQHFELGALFKKCWTSSNDTWWCSLNIYMQFGLL